MKKMYYLFALSILLCLIIPVHANAAELPLISNGYTDNGIYYEVHGEDILPNATTTPITRYVTYQGNVIPPNQISWRETTNGIIYSGTLQLTSYVFIKKDNITTATYTGKLSYTLSQ